jgi:conjugative transfer signal peptidase TraF
MTGRGAGGLSVVAALASLVVVLAMAWRVGLRVNLTGSLPVGFYLATGSAPVRGALVLVCLPPDVAALAHARGFVPPGVQCPGGLTAVGKPVVAIAGDTVTVAPAQIVVNGAAVPNSRALAFDRHGRPLPRLAAGRYVVAPGTVWVVSSFSRFSFDSRYFGAIDARHVRATIRPVWTAGSAR